MTLVLRFFVSFGLLALVVALADWRAVLAALARVDARWVAAAVALMVLDRIVLTQRWSLLLRARGIAPGFGRLLRVQFAANFLGLFFPGSIGLDALRVGALARAGHDVPDVAAATFVDRVSQACAWLFVGSAMILVFAGTHVPAGYTDPVLALAAAVLVGFALLWVPGVGARLRRTGARLVPDRVARVVGRVLDATLRYRGDRRLWLRVAGWTLVMFAVRVLYAKALVSACGVDVPLATLAVFVPLVLIALMLPITVGGFGVLEVAWVAVLAVAGVPAAVAVGVAFVDHAAARLATLPGALFASDLYEKGRGADPPPSREPPADVSGGYARARTVADERD